MLSLRFFYGASLRCGCLYVVRAAALRLDCLVPVGSGFGSSFHAVIALVAPAVHRFPVTFYCCAVLVAAGLPLVLRANVTTGSRHHRTPHSSHSRLQFHCGWLVHAYTFAYHLYRAALFSTAFSWLLRLRALLPFLRVAVPHRLHCGLRLRLRWLRVRVAAFRTLLRSWIAYGCHRVTVLPPAGSATPLHCGCGCTTFCLTRLLPRYAFCGLHVATRVQFAVALHPIPVTRLRLLLPLLRLNIRVCLPPPHLPGYGSRGYWLVVRIGSGLH